MGESSHFSSRVESESFQNNFESSQVESSAFPSRVESSQDIFSKFLFSVYFCKEPDQNVFVLNNIFYTRENTLLIT